MTEYELSTLAQAAIGNVIAVQALFFSALSAYLVVAYLVGAKLSRAQVWTVTGIFSLFSIFLLGTIHFLSNQISSPEFLSITRETEAGTPVKLQATVITSIFSSGYVAALIFMAQVRRKARSIGG